MITKNPKKHIFFVYICLGLISVSVLVGGFFWKSFQKKAQFFSNRFYPNVWVDKINFGGKTWNQADQELAAKYRGLSGVNYIFYYNNEAIATYSAEKLRLISDYKDVLKKAFAIGRNLDKKTRTYEQISSLFNLKSFHFSSIISYDRSVINEFIGLIEDRYNKPAKNALFKFEAGKVVSFRQEEKGLKILSDRLTVRIDNTITDLKLNQRDQRLSVENTQIEPEISLSKANQFGIEELIGEGKSDFSHSIPERVYNVNLAASKFNGVLIPKDQEFSFNNSVGDISSLTGYKPAYIIKGGKTVLGDGGGVCQVSTTLFRAALNTGLPIIQRIAHAYRVGYYENDSKPGLDATVFAPYADLIIRNDTPAYILIQTEIDKDNNLLFFRLYGKKDNRKVELSPVSLYDVGPPPPPVYQDDPNLKKGTTKQIDFAAWGGKANFRYKVINNGQVSFEKSFFSAYRPWQAVFLVGTAD